MNLCHKLEPGATVWEAVKWAEAYLEESGRPDVAVDAKLLMLDVLKWNETTFLLERQKVMNEAKLQLYKDHVSVRASGVPLQHITGTQEFMGLEFKVNENVLIPRQDTETLVEHLLEKLKGSEPLKGIDIGTGSGCIGISLAYYRKMLEMLLVDISPKALEVAKFNIKAHHLEKCVQTLESNLLEAYQGEEVDFIVSNPPYIAKADMAELMTEVKDHEPHLALTDEGDGLYFYRTISKQAKSYLKENGVLAYEIGYNQGEAVTTILRTEGYKAVKLYQDLAGNDRVIIARK